MVSGIYEYSVRNFYITFIKAKKTDNEEDITEIIKLKREIDDLLEVYKDTRTKK